MLAAMRRLPQYIATLKHGGWQQSGLKAVSMPPNFGLGMVLQGAHVGHLGLRQDRPAGRRLWPGVRHAGHRVGQRSVAPRAVADGCVAATSREALFENSDVLSLHLRLVPATRGIVNAADLARMRPTSLFVNTSRAELVEEGALVTGLNRGRPGMAAVDVFESEPILQGHPLLRLENAVCTPHIGYVELDATSCTSASRSTTWSTSSPAARPTSSTLRR